MEGIFVINKPQGITSHDVVDHMRRKFNMKRVGHAGTLDPLATGVLVMLMGKATKLFNKFVDFDKSYRATLVLGVTTDSADLEGEVLSQAPYSHISEDMLHDAFKKFEGEIEQVPPMVSAVKHKGRKLYELARKGIVVERQPRKVTIHELKIEKIDAPDVQFLMSCSKGTYVRQLAHDVGEELGCGASISRIERTAVGPFALEDSVTIEEVNESHLRHWKS